MFPKHKLSLQIRVHFRLTLPLGKKQQTICCTMRVPIRHVLTLANWLCFIMAMNLQFTRFHLWQKKTFGETEAWTEHVLVALVSETHRGFSSLPTIILILLVSYSAPLMGPNNRGRVLNHTRLGVVISCYIWYWYENIEFAIVHSGYRTPRKHSVVKPLFWIKSSWKVLWVA